MNWLSLQDDELPNWAHTAAVLMIATVFALPWLWLGVKAMVTGQLAPTMGPEFGAWLFGAQVLHGRAAWIGGSSLIVLGLVFFSWGVACTRWAEQRRTVRMLPWCLLGLEFVLFRWAGAGQ